MATPDPNKELDAFKDQDVETQGLPDNGTVYGQNALQSVKELQVGFGTSVLRVDQQGLWLGAAKFVDAPFSVDMEGNMVANSITISGYIPTGGALADVGVGNITGTYIANGSIITAKLAANAVTAAKIDVTDLFAQTITASGSITGLTITGGIVQTSSSGLRTVLDSADDRIKFMSGSTTHGFIEPYGGGTNIGVNFMTGSSSGGAEIILNEGTSFNYAYIGYGGSGLTVCYSDGSTPAYNQSIVCDYPPVPSSNAGVDLGSSSLHWRNLYLNSVGNVTSGGSAGTPFPSGWSVTSLATGRYQVTHNFGTTNYAVIINPVVSVAKVWAIESKNSNNFVVRIASTAFALENNAFDFIVIRN